MEIESINIRQPYTGKGHMIGTIKIKGVYGDMELKLDPELIQPVVAVVAEAIARAGAAAADALVKVAQECANTGAIIDQTAAKTEAAKQLQAKVDAALDVAAEAKIKPNAV